MRAIRNIAIAGMIMLFGSPNYGQNGKVLNLSLQEAIDLAQTRSYDIQIADSRVRQASGRNLESMSGFLPRISLSENYIKSNDPVTVFSLKLKQGLFTEQDFNIATLNDPDALDNFTTSLQVTQPLFNLDAIYGKSAANLGVKAHEAMAERARETVQLEVSKAYYSLILAHENLRAIRKALASARSHRDDARVAFDEGLINQADYLAAEVRLAELEEQLITGSHNIAAAGDGLKFIMGLEEEADIVPTDTLEINKETAKIAKPAQLVATRSDLRAIDLQTRAAGRNLWMKRSAWVPGLNAFGAMEWNAADAFGKDASNWAFGLQLQWNPFEGLGKFGRARQAAAQQEESQIRYRQAEEQARMEVRTAQRAVRAAEERIQVAQHAVEQAQESLRIAEERFRQGLETTSDVLDREVALTNTRLRVLRAKHDFNVSLSVLDYALGRTNTKQE